MQINIPLIRQDRDSVDCGLACTAMVLEYYGIKTEIENLKRETKVYKFGTFAPQLGLILLKKGLKVSITTLNPGLFTLKDEKLSQAEIVDKLEESILKKKGTNKLALKYFIEFCRNNGKINVRIPETSEIKENILKKQPVIALLTSNFLQGDNADLNYHFNVITGFDADSFYINDPLWNKFGGEKRFAQKDYLYAIHASVAGDLDNGSLMITSK